MKYLLLIFVFARDPTAGPTYITGVGGEVQGYQKCQILKDMMLQAMQAKHMFAICVKKDNLKDMEL